MLILTRLDFRDLFIENCKAVIQAKLEITTMHLHSEEYMFYLVAFIIPFEVIQAFLNKAFLNRERKW